MPATWPPLRPRACSSRSTPDILRSAIPAELSDPDQYWYGLTIRARTIVYNRDRLDESEVPTTYEELAEPDWEGRLCLRNSSNVYQQSLVAA